MRYIDISDLGGFLWWIVWRQCKSSLKEEQHPRYWARNILVVMITIVLLCSAVFIYENG